MISRRTLLSTSTAALAGATVAGLTGCTKDEPAAQRGGGAKSNEIVLAADVNSLLSSTTFPAIAVAGAKPAQTRIATPHLLMDVVQIGVLTELDGQTARALGLPGTESATITQTCVPAPGQEFVAVQLLVAGAVFGPGSKDAPVVGVKAGKRRNFRLGAYNQTLRSYANSSLVAVLSVPIGTPASVVVDDLDLTASYDLRTGRSGKDADTARLTAACTLDAVSVSPKTAKWAGGWTDGRNADLIKVEWDFTAKSCYLGEWVPGAGWAPKGKRWLVLAYRPSYESKLFTPMTIDLGSARVRASGKSHHPTTKKKVKVTDWMTAIYDSYLTFAVPDSFRKGTFELDFPRTLTVTYRDGQKRTWPNRGASRPLKTTITTK